MKLSPSLPPTKNCKRTPRGVEQVSGDLVWSKVRYGGFFMASFGNI